jgi:nucleoside-diphosphate-sugar epimerase/predicted dehydrogenase
MKIGLVGCGQIAYVHVPFILKAKGHRLVGVCDADRGRAEALAQRFQIGRVFDNFEQLLAQKPDIVHVLTPPRTHAALAMQAMAAGCHVLVEKPMALSLEEADAMITAARTHRVKLCINHNQLFDPVILQAQQLLAKGFVGTVVGIESYYGFNLAQTSERRWVENLPGGVFQNLAPHPLSLLLQFLRAPLDLHVTTLVTGVLGPDVPDELRLLVRGADTVGTLTISLGIKPHLNFLRIYGSKAVLHADLANMILSTERLRPLPKAAARALMNIEHGLQLASGAVYNAVRFMLGRLKPYQGLGNLIYAFYESIVHDHAPPVSGEDARRVVEIFARIQERIPASTIRPRAQNRSRKEGPRVFVTGGSGFVGSHLLKKLTQQGAMVRALVRPTSRIGHLRELEVDWVEGDLADVEALTRAIDGCDVVYHCAAATNGSWNDHLQGTVRGTERLLMASAAVGVRRFVHISSLSVYGVSLFKDRAWVTEDAPYEPHPEQRGHYAHAKIEAEKLVLGYGQEKGLPITILRPGTIYGPGGKIFFPRIGYSLKNQVFLIIGRGEHVLPLTYVENVADAICLAGTRAEAIGQIYNIVDDDNITQRAYLDELVRMVGLKARIVHVPFGCLYVTASLLEAQAVLSKTTPFLSRYRLVCGAKDLRYDTSRAKQQLQWKPDVSLAEGLSRTFEWYRHQRGRW